MWVVYGSQTGQSKSLAEGIVATSNEKGLKFQISSFENVKDINETKLAFLIVSTTGDGDLPDNCLNYFRKLRKKPDGCLASFKFGLLALGDTNYSNFCAGGKAVEKALLSKGAEKIFETIYGDDAVGIEDQVEEFCSNIWNVTEKLETCDSVNLSNMKIASDVKDIRSESNWIIENSFPFSCKEFRPSSTKNSFPVPSDLKLPAKQNPSLDLKFFSIPTEPQGSNIYFGMASTMRFCSIKDISIMSGAESQKTTLKVKLEGSLDYQPGDSFSVVLPNDPLLVDLLLKKLKVHHLADIPMQRKLLSNTSKTDSSFAHIPEVSTLRYIFSYCVDFATTPFKKAFFRLLAEYASNEEQYQTLMRLSSRQGSEEYNTMRGQMMTLLDILHVFDSCKPPVERIIESLPVLLPRPYSFASSPLDDPTSFEFVFNVVEITEQFYRKKRFGLATGWFKNHIDEGCFRGEISVPLFLRSNTSFRMPEDPKVPLILIGPGTGVAPFIGFLRHRKALIVQQKTGSSDFGSIFLLFGCRNEKNDYLYESELKDYETEGVITQLFTCFSRDEGSEFKYVQDVLQKEFMKFGDLIMNQNANVYICGDAFNMAKDVNEALVTVIEKCMKISNTEARGVMVKLRSEPKRVKEDVWT